MDADAPITLSTGLHARAVRVRGPHEVADALGALGLGTGRPVLVLVGGADDLPDSEGLGPLLAAVVTMVSELDASVVDGGTDAGVMRLVGRARRVAGAAFPLVGVAAEGTVVVPGGARATEQAAPLEPNHTHFVLVPGSEWGDEVPWLGRVAEAVAGGAPSATLLVDGGELARRDVEASVAAGRPVVVVAGSGRAADELAAQEDVNGALASGLVTVAAPAAVSDELARLLGGLA